MRGPHCASLSLSLTLPSLAVSQSLTPSLSRAQWHPFRPLIASVSTLGLIHLWVTPVVENWSAYAPGFEELDENREYEEKEDEFDFVRLALSFSL